jgi:hypothetical protein
VVKKISTIAMRFLSVLILTFWVGTALADKRVALIIGNSQYAHLSPKLVNPANDAYDIAQALGSIGFDVILRTDLGQGEFEHALAEFARKATDADTALFFYAGHGLQNKGRNYFLPTDIEVQDAVDVEYRAIDQGHVLSAVERAKGVKVVILDACRDNPLARQLIATRSWGGGGETHGLARIDNAEDTIVAYATAPDHVANDGDGRNSPFTAALLNRIKEPGLEITTMFRRVANDVYERTKGTQHPEVTTSLRTDYFLNPSESDSAAWGRVRDSTDPADFIEFIRKFPASPFAREAQFRIDLFERIRRENAEAAKKEHDRIALEAEQKRRAEEAKKEADRIALDAEQKRRAEEAKKEAERITLEAEQKRRAEETKKEAERVAIEAEQKRRAEEAKKEAERVAIEAEQKRQAEEAKKEAELIAQQKNEAARLEMEKAAAQRREAERLQAEKRAAAERAKVAALEEENRKAQELEREKQRIAGICTGDLAKLKDFTAARQTPAIQNLAKESTCPTIQPAIQTALHEVTRAIKQACDADRKTLASLKGSDIESLKSAAGRMSCEPVRAEAQQRAAKLEGDKRHEDSVCADEKTKLGGIDANAAAARQQLVEFSARAACPSLRAEVTVTLKTIEARVSEAQTELTRLGCYNAPVSGKFDEATKTSLTLYHTKKGSLADGDHLTDGLLSELKHQKLALCPPVQPAAPAVALPSKKEETTPPKQQTIEHAKREEEARPERPRKKIETGEREEEPAAKPSKRHRVHDAIREEEPAEPAPRHRIQRAEREEAPAPRVHQKPRPSYASERPKSYAVQRVRRAPSMPMSSTATSGSGHSGATVGVGF